MSIAQSPKSGADSDAPGTARALLAPGATLARLLAGAFLLAVVAFLVWGWRYQPPREDPWAPAGFWEWWLSPLPDPLYRSMPVTPGAPPAALFRRICAAGPPTSAPGWRSTGSKACGSSPPNSHAGGPAQTANA